MTKGYFWVRIGDLGTNEPIVTSLKDEFMAKQAFSTYKGILLRASEEINDSAVVLVRHYEKSMKKTESFFEGNYINALEWAG